MAITQYLLQVKLGESCPAWKMTFHVGSDNMAREFARKTLTRDYKRWIGLDFELWREPEQTLITKFSINEAVSVSSQDI